MWKAVRSYSTPQFPSKGNIVINALNYVKQVDAYQDNIAKNTPEAALATQLVTRIEDKPELLLLLLLFHRELAQFGITPGLNRDFSTLQMWRFRWACTWKLHRIHSVFWEQCRYQNLAERDHKLRVAPQDVGVLDPKYFSDTYQELQSGIFRGTDFRHVEILGKRFE